MAGENIFSYFKEGMEASDILYRLQGYQQQASSILTRIQNNEKAFHQAYAEEFNEYEQTSYHFQARTKAHQQLINFRKNFSLEQDYLEGYKLLNEIGHAFNGEWNYTVVVKDAGGQMISFTLTEEQFLPLINMDHLGRATLVSDNTVLQKMANAQITGQKWDGTSSNPLLNQNIYNTYSDVINYAKGIMINGKATADYNSGQILEAYLAFNERQKEFQTLVNNMSILQEITSQAEDEHLGDNFQLLVTMINNIRTQMRGTAGHGAQGFWAGPDTPGFGQVKGSGASIFTYTSIERQLNKFLQLTKTLDFTNLEVALSKESPNLHNNLKLALDRQWQKIKQGFNLTTLKGQSVDILGSIEDLSTEIRDLTSDILGC